MRLLNVHTYKLREFTDADRPPYAIASHRWAVYEITLQDFEKWITDNSYWLTGPGRDGLDLSLELPPWMRDPFWDTGIQKVMDFCGVVRRWKRPSLDWLWIDTCCIDKTNSTELSEAVNSMHRWYTEVYVCLAYLADVRDFPWIGNTLFGSTWFTRGCKLQELLAPQLVVLFNRDWECLGHKANTSVFEEMDLRWSCQVSDLYMIRLPLHKDIATITGIPEAVLQGQIAVKDIDILTRLTWMSKRTTTRQEDRVYCMIGICDTFMPLIYGEGDHAQQRLAQLLSSKHGGSVASYTLPTPHTTTSAGSYSAHSGYDGHLVLASPNTYGTAPAACANSTPLITVGTTLNAASVPAQAYAQILCDTEWSEGIFEIPVASAQPLMIRQNTNAGVKRRIEGRTTGRKRQRAGLCPVKRCETATNLLDDPRQHMLSHLKPYKCTEPECSQQDAFAIPQDLDNHRKSVHHLEPSGKSARNYVCTLCPRLEGSAVKMWTRKDNYRAHMQRFHPEQDDHCKEKSQLAEARDKQSGPKAQALDVVDLSSGYDEEALFSHSEATQDAIDRFLRSLGLP